MNESCIFIHHIHTLSIRIHDSFIHDSFVYFHHRMTFYLQFAVTWIHERKMHEEMMYTNESYVNEWCAVCNWPYSPFPRRWDSKWWKKCKSKSWMVGRFWSICQNRENQISRYLTVQIRIEILIGFEFRCISRYTFKVRLCFNLNVQLTKISPPFRISICISLTISSLIFAGTGCNTNIRMNDVWMNHAYSCYGQLQIEWHRISWEFLKLCRRTRILLMGFTIRTGS